MYTERACGLIQNHTRDNPVNTPLFLYLPYQNTHGPLQAPKEETEKFKASIPTNTRRRIFAAMVKTLDDAVGKVSWKNIKSSRFSKDQNVLELEYS